MKIFNLLVCIWFFSCGKNNTLNKGAIKDIQERREEILLHEVVGNNESKDLFFSNENNIFELGSPLWYLDQAQFRILGPIQYETITSENNLWGNVKRYFFSDLGRYYFNLNQGEKDSLSLANLFSSDINFQQQKKSVSEKENYEISGFSKTIFFPGSESEYSPDDYHQSLKFDEVLSEINMPLFEKKLIQGENFFFNSNDIKLGRIDDFYLERQTDKIFHQHEKYKTIEVLASGFNLRGYSDNQFRNLIKKNYNILFFFKKKMRVFLFKKSLDHLEVLSKIDPEIELDESGQVLRTSTLRRNLFLQDSPRPMFFDNELNSEGALLFAQRNDEQTIYLFFEGSYKDILEKQYQYFPKKNFSKGSTVALKIGRGELFKIESRFKNIRHNFKEYIKDVEVVNKKPIRVCERPERTKFCVDTYQKFRKKAVFREYLSREVVDKGSVKEEDVFSKEEKRGLGALNLFNDKFYYKVKDAKLTEGEIKLKLKNPKCREVKTGFIKFVEADETIKLTAPQHNLVRTYCDGPIYENTTKRITLK